MKAAYTVIWKESLINGALAEFVLREMEDGLGSGAVAAAMVESDQRLSSRPMETGESRSGIERIVFVPPLAVTYEVREADRIV